MDKNRCKICEKYTEETSREADLLIEEVLHGRDLDLDAFSQIPHQTVPGIDIKNLENVAFSSTMLFVLDMEEFNRVLNMDARQYFEQLQENVGRQLAKYLVLNLGFFDWEKEVAYIQNIDKDSVIVNSQVIPTRSLEDTFQVMVNFQIKIKQVGAEMKHIMVRDLPPEELFLRENLMLDIAMLLQYEIRGFMEDLPVKHSLVIVRNPYSRDWLPWTWKSRLTVRDISFEDQPDMIRCTVIRLKSNDIFSKKYLLSRDLGNTHYIPLLWAKKTGSIAHSCSLFEADGNGKSCTDRLQLLGVVRSNPFGHHTVYETFQQTPDGKFYLKEVAAVKQPSKKLFPKIESRHHDGMTLLLPSDPQFVPSAGSWKRSKGAYKYKALAKKWESGERSDLRAFRNDLSGWSKMTKIQVNDDAAGRPIFRLEKLDKCRYTLEYGWPFDALTAFSVVLSTI